MNLCFYWFQIAILSFVSRQCKSESKKPFSLPQNYSKDLPPLQNGQPVTVYVQILIYQISEINERNRNVKLNLYFFLRWKDFQASTTQKSVGLQKEDMKLFWKPKMVVMNMESMAPKVAIEEMIYFFVTENHWIRYLYGVLLVLPCPFEFKDFPFDIQKCQMNLTMRVHGTNAVQLEWGKEHPVAFSSFKGPIKEELPTYDVRICAVKEAAVRYGASGNFSRLVTNIILARGLRSYLLTMYVPCTIFVFVSWCSFTVNPEIVPGRAIMIVTSLLSLITMFQSTTSKSPPSVQIQALDIWIIICMSFVFAALLEYATILYQLKSRPADSDGIKSAFTPIKHLALYRQYRRRVSTTKPNKFRSWVKKIASNIRMPATGTDKWPKEDRVSIFLFPSTFIVCATIYWTSYLQRRRQLDEEHTCN